MRAAVIAAAALGLGWVAPLLAFEPSPASARPGHAAGTLGAEELEVPLVELEVAVEDSSGRPLASLDRDEFELLLDGRPVPIQLFQPAAAGAAAPLTLLVFVDSTFLEPGDLPPALEATAQWLRRGTGEGTFLLATAEPGLHLRQAPTRDREALAAALTGLRSLSGTSRAADEFRQIRREMDRILTEGRQSNQRNPDHYVQALQARISAYGAETRREIEAAVQRTQRLAASLAGLPGRKVLLEIGGRLPLLAEDALGDVWNAAFGPGSRWDAEQPADGVAGLEQPRGRVQAGERAPILLQLAESANQHGVTLYFVDAGGLRPSGELSGGLGRGTGVQISGSGVLAGGARGSAMEAPLMLEEMAEATGGRALVRSGRFEEGLEQWSRDLASRYVLGFSPPGEASAHQVEVRLRAGRPAATVRHRRSVRVRSADDASTEKTLSALLLGTGDNPLEVEVILGESGDGSKTLELAVQLPLANLALVPDGKFHIGRFSVFTAAGNFSGDLPPVAKAVVPVRIPNDELLTALGRRVEYRLSVPGDRSATGIAVGVRDDFVPVTATVRLPLESGLAPDLVKAATF